VRRSESQRQNPHRSRRQLALALAYVIAALASAGIFLAWRVYVHHATLVSREFFFIGGIHQADDTAGFRMAPHRTGFAVLQGGVQDPARRIPLRTDARGFRIPLASDASRPSGAGLAGIGCSCTFGHGVTAESTWVEVAGGRLGLPVDNLGVCAYSTVTSVELLRRSIAALRPRLVVYAFGNFHLERSRRPWSDVAVFQPSLTTDHGEPRLLPPRFDNHLIFALSPGIEREYYQEKLEGRTPHFDLEKLRLLWPLACQDLGRTLHPATWRARFAPPAVLSDTTLARWAIGELLRLARPYGTRVVLLYFPAFYGETPLPGLLQAVHEHANDADFLFVDTAPGLFAPVHNQDQYAARFQVPRDGHPNAAMHQEMARVLVAALTAAPWLAEAGSETIRRK